MTAPIASPPPAWPTLRLAGHAFNLSPAGIAAFAYLATERTSSARGRATAAEGVA